MRIMKTNGMMKNILFAMMAVMMLGSIVALSGCSKDSNDDPDPSGDEVDARIEKVVPPDLRAKMEKYIPIYDGINPPNVEGIYLASPSEMVYDSNNDYEPGKIFVDYYYKFSNQNNKNNTVDYNRTNKSGDDTESSTGAFISGEGKNFTIFFNTTGTYLNITMKRALLVSGTMASEGIKNLVWAFVVTEKGNDPDNKLMDIGQFRVVKDGNAVSERSEWPTGTRGISDFLIGESDVTGHPCQ
jgi:hypothetical protein